MMNCSLAAEINTIVCFWVCTHTHIHRNNTTYYKSNRFGENERKNGGKNGKIQKGQEVLMQQFEEKVSEK